MRAESYGFVTSHAGSRFLIPYVTVPQLPCEKVPPLSTSLSPSPILSEKSLQQSHEEHLPEKSPQKAEEAVVVAVGEPAGEPRRKRGTRSAEGRAQGPHSSLRGRGLPEIRRPAGRHRSPSF